MHPNEAVFPPSKGRKIGVELSGGEAGEGGGVKFGDTTNNSSVTIDAAGDLSDPKVATRLAGQLGQAVQVAVKAEMVQALQYGGMMNPRGR